MKLNGLIRLISSVVLSLLLAVSAQATDAPTTTTTPLPPALQALARLVEQANYPAAWQQAQGLLKTYEGDPAFDYLLGVAALETGQLDHALFALQRVVASTPDAARPRLELARTQVQLGNHEAALGQLRAALRLQPPAAVRQNILRYIERIESSHPPQVVLSGYTSLASGYDSNANFGVETETLSVPIFGSITLDANSVKRASPFVEARGQLASSYPINAQLSWFNRAGLGQKHYSRAADFDTRDLTVQSGLAWYGETRSYRLAFTHQRIDLDNTEFSQARNLELGMSQAIADNAQLGLSLSQAQLRHIDQPEQNKDHQRIATTYSVQTGSLGHQLELSAVRETPESSRGLHHSRQMRGLNYQLQGTWGNRQSSSLGIGVQERRHRANDPVYEVPRQDQRFTVNIGHQLALSKKTTVSASAGTIRNDSNLGLYDTRKHYVRVGVAYQF